MRRLWIQLHLWLGLTLGVLGIFVGITGSILVYDHGIDAWLNPQRYAVSGPKVALPYGEYLKSAAQVLEGRARPFNVRLPEGAEGGKPIPLERAIKIAQDLHPGAPVAGIGLPAGPRGVYRVNLLTGGSAAPVNNAAVFIDPRSGEVLRDSAPATRSRGDDFLVTQRLLHAGEVFGPLGRVLMFATGLLPALFAITGAMMWLRQRRGKISRVWEEG